MNPQVSLVRNKKLKSFWGKIIYNDLFHNINTVQHPKHVLRYSKMIIKAIWVINNVPHEMHFYLNENNVISFLASLLLAEGRRKFLLYFWYSLNLPTIPVHRAHQRENKWKREHHIHYLWKDYKKVKMKVNDKAYEAVQWFSTF